MAGRPRLVTRPGGIQDGNDQIMIAAGLLRHGVSGVRTKKESGKPGKPAEEIDVWEAVYAAMAHFDMPQAEALKLTMTEFVKLCEMKFPDPDKKSDSAAPTVEEQKEALAWFETLEIAKNG